MTDTHSHHNTDTENINTKGSIHNPIDIEANTAEGSTQNAGEIILIKEETRQASGGKAHPIDIERPMQDGRAECCMEEQQSDMKQKIYYKGVDTTGGGNTTGGQIGNGPQKNPYCPGTCASGWNGRREKKKEQIKTEK